MTPDPVPSIFDIGSRMAFSLLVVAAVIFIGYFLIKRLGMPGMKGSIDARMSVLSCLPLAPKKSVYLVHIADSVLVLGVTDEQITLLDKIENAETVENYLRDKNETTFAKTHHTLFSLFGKGN